MKEKPKTEEQLKKKYEPKYDFSKKDLRRGVYISVRKLYPGYLKITHIYRNVKTHQIEAVSTDYVAKKHLIRLKEIDHILIDKTA